MRTVTNEEAGTVGIILDPQYTKKLLEICRYMDKTVDEMILESIDRMHKEMKSNG